MKDLTGKSFGRLMVVRKAHSKKVPSGTRLFWECVCSCGVVRFIEGASLKSGKSQSCGCRQREGIASRAMQTNTTHGYAASPTYKSWLAMRQRCNNPKAHGYARYGGMGIKVAERWSEFESFLADMGERPSRKYSLDRWPDPYGNYAPDNCRWATRSQQALNRRNLRG